MAGIPVHTASPISPNPPKTTAAKPDTSTAAPVAIQEGPASVAATTTASATSNYPSAQPGAAPFPAPTSTATGHSASGFVPTRTLPPSETPTNMPDMPAPPQPGQAPSPYVPSPHTRNSAVPPPPQASSLPHPNPSQNLATTTTAAPSVPPIQTGYQPPQPTSTSGYSTDLSHPPGYSQNVGGSFEDRSYAGGSSPSRRAGGGILDNDPSRYLGASEGNNLGEEESMWDTAAKWAKVAGQKLSQGEQQIWKMVNNEK